MSLFNLIKEYNRIRFSSYLFGELTALGSEGLPAPSAEVKKYYEQGVMDFVTGKRVLIEENWQQWLNGFTRIGGIDWERKCKNYVESNNLLTE